jgi:hypothetical protein
LQGRGKYLARVTSRRNPIGRSRPGPRVVEQARRATIAPTGSTVATALDPVLLPEQFATGVGQLLDVHPIAAEQVVA